MMDPPNRVVVGGCVLNAHSAVPLFRAEVAAARKDRLHGDVSLAVPLSWQAIGYLLFAAVGGALIFFIGQVWSKPRNG